MTEQEFNNLPAGALIGPTDLNKAFLWLKLDNGDFILIQSEDDDNTEGRLNSTTRSRWIFSALQDVTDDFKTPVTHISPETEPLCSSGCHRDYIGQHTLDCPWLKWHRSRSL